MRKVPCEIYSRVVGYYAPVNRWNHGKRAEFADRKTYKTTHIRITDYMIANIPIVLVNGPAGIIIEEA